jgi:hypothetical protein
MNSEILFTETQKFRQWWVWLIVIGVNGILLFGVYKQIILREPFGDNPLSDNALIVSIVITFLITILVLILRLETIISRAGIHVRFFPFHRQFKSYPWNSITRFYIRKYAAISEYGGWGVRIIGHNKGNALNVSGNKGLQLEFESGEKLLIGTHKPEEILAAVNKINN